MSIVTVDSCRGNLVAISKKVVDVIGYPDGKNLPHALGDADYTLRASEAGIRCLLLTDIFLEELGNIRSDNVSWLLGGTSISEIWRNTFSKKSTLYPRMRWIYLKRHWGWRGILQYPIPYIKLVIISVLRIIFSRKILVSIYGKYSHEWKSSAWTRQ